MVITRRDAHAGAPGLSLLARPLDLSALLPHRERRPDDRPNDADDDSDGDTDHECLHCHEQVRDDEQGCHEHESADRHREAHREPVAPVPVVHRLNPAHLAQVPLPGVEPLKLQRAALLRPLVLVAPGLSVALEEDLRAVVLHHLRREVGEDPGVLPHHLRVGYGALEAEQHVHRRPLFGGADLSREALYRRRRGRGEAALAAGSAGARLVAGGGVSFGEVVEGVGSAVPSVTDVPEDFSSSLGS
nr:hypothetical protein [Deltaproteobacteria bacterium]